MDASQDAVSQEASRWYARLSSDDVSSQEQAAFDAWLEESPPHRHAWERLQALLEEVDQAREWVLASEPERPRGTLATVLGARPVRWAAAAMVLLLAGSWWLGTPAAEETFQTAVAERRSVVLADGSTVHLNAVSRISVVFTPSQRQVQLAQGEALFEVVRDDEARLFVVTAGRGEIRVRGTRFNVGIDPTGTAVTVVEGEVEVAADSGGVPGDEVALRALGAGEQVRYGRDGQLGDVIAVDPEWITAWREGRLIYQGEPLVRVLHDLARYLPGQVLTAEPALLDLRVSGTFRLDDVDGSLEALELALPIRAVRHGNTITFAPDRVDP